MLIKRNSDLNLHFTAIQCPVVQQPLTRAKICFFELNEGYEIRMTRGVVRPSTTGQHFHTFTVIAQMRESTIRAPVIEGIH